MMQVHYKFKTSSPDHSGVRLKVTQEKQERKAGIMVLARGGRIRGHDISQSGEMKKETFSSSPPGPPKASQPISLA